MKPIKESKMLLEVWKAKERAAKEVERLDLKSAIKKRLNDAICSSKELRKQMRNPVK